MPPHKRLNPRVAAHPLAFFGVQLVHSLHPLARLRFGLLFLLPLGVGFLRHAHRLFTIMIPIVIPTVPVAVFFTAAPVAVAVAAD